MAGVSANDEQARGPRRRPLHRYPTVGGCADDARCVWLAADAPRLPLAAEGRPVALAALGSDGGRGFSQRGDRDRIAARPCRRRWRVWRDAWSVVGRKWPPA